MRDSSQRANKHFEVPTVSDSFQLKVKDDINRFSKMRLHNFDFYGKKDLKYVIIVDDDLSNSDARA